ncbi:MAG: transposase [Patescibacteria group bacterium]
MPRAQFAEGEYYHIYNRGVEKRSIFTNDQDRWRFLTLLIILQGDTSIPQIKRILPNVQHWRLDDELFQEIEKNRTVELISFCLMPNHYHLMLGEIKEGGISKFMQRISDSYTKYFNIKYDRSGHLFGGKFQSVHIDENTYLNYLSAYIHLNPRGLNSWHSKEISYPWSSFQDFCKENRFGKFLNPSLILDQFADKKEYRNFVESTSFKKIENRLGSEYLID